MQQDTLYSKMKWNEMKWNEVRRSINNELCVTKQSTTLSTIVNKQITWRPVNPRLLICDSPRFLTTPSWMLCQKHHLVARHDWRDNMWYIWHPLNDKYMRTIEDHMGPVLLPRPYSSIASLEHALAHLLVPCHSQNEAQNTNERDKTATNTLLWEKIESKKQKFSGVEVLSC